MCEGIYSFTNYLSFDEYEHSFPYEILTVVYHYYIPNNFLKSLIKGESLNSHILLLRLQGNNGNYHAQENVQCLLSSLQVILTAAIEFI